MTRLKRTAMWIAPPVVSLIYFWQAFFIWFRIDDFAWLSLPQVLKTAPSPWSVLFTPAAQGTIRVISERLYFLTLSSLFGITHWPFRAVSFLTWFAVLFLTQAIGRRLTGSRAAGFFAALLWAAHGCLTTPLTWASSYNQLLIAFIVLLAFYARLRWIESNETKWRITEALAYLAGFGVLETIVMYPAIVLLHSALDPRARERWRSSLWMLVPAALFALMHLFFIPKTDSTVYARVLDARLPVTLWRYTEWTLAPWRIAALGPTTQLLGRWLFAAIVLALAAYCVVRVRQGSATSAINRYVPAYRKRFGNVFGADDAAELFPEYRESDESRAQFHSLLHDSFRRVRDRAFEQALTEPKSPRQVILLSGGSCAGKTTIAPSLLPALVYDTTLSNLAGARAIVQKALDAGKEVIVVHIRRPIEECFEANLRRATQATGAGRTTNIIAMIRTHKGSDEVIQQLARDSRIKILAFQNTGHELCEVAIETLQPRDYTGVDDRLREILERERANLPTAVYQAGLGRLVAQDHRGGGEVRGQGRSVSAGLPTVRPAQADFAPIALFLGWFLIWIAPVVPLANHISAYYLTVPGIGFAWLAGSALARALTASLPWRAGAAILALGYFLGSSREVSAETNWLRGVTSRIRFVAQAIESTAAAHPGNSILVYGLDELTFAHGMVDNMHVVLGNPRIWLPPGDLLEQTSLRNVGRFRTTPEAVFSALERHELRVISLEGGVRLDVTAPYHASQSVRIINERTTFVDVGLPRFASRLGDGWHQIENGTRWSAAAASLRLDIPDAARTLHITGYTAESVLGKGPVRIDFSANGQKIGSLSFKSVGLFALDLPLPATLAGKAASIELRCDRTYNGDGRELGMIFGTFTAR